MKHNIQTYFDTAKKVRNTSPLLSKEEILRQVQGSTVPAHPLPLIQQRPYIKPLLAGSLLVAASVAAVFMFRDTTPSAPKVTLQSPVIQTVPSSSPQNPKSERDAYPTAGHTSASVSATVSTQVTIPVLNHNDLLHVPLSSSSATKPNLAHSPIFESTPPSARANDIEGVKKIELSETEAVLLATHYPKLHIWLQRKYIGTDTCDITLAPSENIRSDNSQHHSAVLLRITFDHAEAREFLLWFTPNPEFTSALPGRYREQLQNELSVLADVETRCIPAEQACKAVKNESPFFDLCRRESGALSGVSIAPNPARENAECTFTLKDQRDISISLHDLNGRFVRTMIFSELKPSGENRVPLMLDGIPAGAYLLALRTDRGEQAVQQLVVGQ